MHGVDTKPANYRVNSQVLLLRGNGCSRHNNCFTCPFEICDDKSKLTKHLDHKWWYTDGLDYSETPI